jgi:threonine dehydratase
MLLSDRIASTYELIRPFIRRTPILEDDNVVFKLELLQHAGSFKTRGAFANLLLREIPEAGVAAASGGNHGAAVAYAAMRRNVPATIFVPEISSPAKVQRIRDYGAKLVVGGARYGEALKACDAFVAESGALPVHAFDQLETILGQGTLGLELAEQAPAIDTVLVGVGGGGLLAGVASWYAGAVRVVAVEPIDAPTLARAFEAGGPVDAPAGGIAADSLAPYRVGELVYPIARQYVETIVHVTDDDIRNSQRTLWDRMRIVAEPGAAAAFGALLAGKYVPAQGERVAVVISGANTNAVDFGR